MSLRQLYTSGQPRPGDEEFARLLAGRVEEAGAGYFRYVNRFDTFPFTPPHYADVGEEIYIDRHGRFWRSPVARKVRQSIVALKRILLNLATGLVDHDNSVYLSLVRKSRHTPPAREDNVPLA